MKVVAAGAGLCLLIVLVASVSVACRRAPMPPCADLANKAVADVDATVARQMSIAHDAATADADIAAVNLRCAMGLPGSEDVDAAKLLAELNQWADQVRRETEQNLWQFEGAPGEFEHSEAYFRILMMIVVLQEDCGVRYNPDRLRDVDFTDSGTCSSTACWLGVAERAFPCPCCTWQLGAASAIHSSWLPRKNICLPDGRTSRLESGSTSKRRTAA